jgi:NAD(P)-dependent dehydrogenase (short-subunit alcohol dehydrogenase family)
MPTPLRCDPKLFEKDLTGQIIIVTGANSGCGLETSRQLSKQGATVVMACRNKERGEAAAKDVDGVFIGTMDLGSLESVKDFVKLFQEKYDRLDVLVNNAGIMACPYSKTKDDFEIQLGCNHLAHFYLMRSLTPILLQTAEATGKPSRFVALSSCAASRMAMKNDTEYATIDFDDLMWETKEYDEGLAYKQSKLANYLHAMEAANKYPADKLISTAVHPGWVQSNLDVHILRKMFGDHFLGHIASEFVRKIFLFKGDMITAIDGAQASLHCVLEDADKMESGAFYSQMGLYKNPKLADGAWPTKLSINPEHATPDNAAKLWEVSDKLVGL